MNWTIIFLCQLGLPDCSSINLEVLFCLDYDWTVYETWWVYLALESCWVFLAMFIRNEMHRPNISFFCGFRVCKTRFIVVSDLKKMKLCLLQFVLLMNWIVTLRRITCLTLDLVCIYFSVWGFPWLISGWWFGTWIWFFPFFGNFIIPTDELTPSFFRGVGWNHQFHVFCGKIPREVFCQWFLWAEFRTGSPGSPEMSWATLVPIDPITMFFLGGL
jgi:hypothetical protein